ncbi:carbohydrate sulfotransferase 1-like [Glandiceps talaboti]
MHRPHVENFTCAGRIPQKRIIIAAKARTGSTFFGELFNQNRRIFYVFEPLFVTLDMLAKDGISEFYRQQMSVEILNNLVNCDFLTYLVYEFQNWVFATAYSKAINAICELKGDCQDLGVAYLKMKCEEYDTMVIKTIRVEDMSTLFPNNSKDRCLDLHGILYVRDPRAVALSRKRFQFHHMAYESLQGIEIDEGSVINEKKAEMLQHVQYYCKWVSRNTAFVKKAPKLVREKLTILRYEDLVANVTHKTLELYNTFGLEVSQDVFNWIEENTNASSEQDMAGIGTMITKRNSSAVAQAWRSKLSMDEVRLVQETCGDVMDHLGYTLIKNEKELSDLSIQLVKPFSLG